MFCSKCGTQIPEGGAFCPNCGTPVRKFSNTVEEVKEAADAVFVETDNQIGAAVNEVKVTLSDDKVGYNGQRLNDNRGILAVFILSLITCGIYDYWFVYTIARDANVACAEDGEVTAGLAKFIIFSILTCGIYTLYWKYALGNRLQAAGPRYNLTISDSGTSVLMWEIIGFLVCGLGPIFGTYILIKSSNKICHAYNVEHGL